MDKNNLSCRVEHAKAYAKAAVENGMPCIWWDNNYLESNKSNTMGILIIGSLRLRRCL